MLLDKINLEIKILSDKQIELSSKISIAVKLYVCKKSYIVLDINYENEFS